MLSTNDAFRKFKRRLELNSKEQSNAIKRHSEVRALVARNFKIERDFLTGSYKRHTKTKPLKDVDIFFVLDDSERSYRSKKPSVVLDDFAAVLSEEYGERAVQRQSHSVGVDFGVVVDANDDTDYRILSVDAVPAFSEGENFEIPCGDGDKWIKTNPEIHADRATQAHQNFSNEWKGLVRMIKYWNNQERHGEKPIKPSFLIEVMAIDCLFGGWEGRFDYEVEGLFSTLADRIFEEWPDPAGLGPCVSDSMDNARKERARSLLKAASREARNAINLANNGKNGESLRAWRELFGVKFPLS